MQDPRRARMDELNMTAWSEILPETSAGARPDIFRSGNPLSRNRDRSPDAVQKPTPLPFAHVRGQVSPVSRGR